MNYIDEIYSYFNPVGAIKRDAARRILAYTGGAGGYIGGRRDRRMMRKFRPKNDSADASILPDLPDLRNRSRDLARNAPIAGGAINTVVTNVVGNGIQLKPEINAKHLGLTDDQADAWEQNVLNEWKLFCKTADFTSVQHFQDLQSLLFRSTLESGDIFTVRRFRKDFGDVYGTKLQFIEADRVSNKGHAQDGTKVGANKVYAGVEVDRNGRHKAYWIQRDHPGAILAKGDQWDRQTARSKSGVPLVLHLYDRLRPDQTRGVPYLSTVIEPLKQMSDYSEAEITAAVVSSMFTAFITSESGNTILDTDATTASGVFDADSEVSMGAGAVVDLSPGESVSFADPSRPNANFEPFMQAFLRQVGSALELPFEVLIKHFTSSYSASRAALEMAWQFFSKRRGWLVRNFLQPVYEWFLEEAVALGRVSAPGFLNDPGLRMAYSNANWVGPVRIGLDPLKEAKADELDINTGLKTREMAIMERTGGTWEGTHAQLVKETNRRKEDDIHTEVLKDNGNEPPN